MANTTDAALTLAKTLSMWPSGTGPLTDTQLLSILTEECRRRVFPAVLRAQQDYYVLDKDFTITADQQLYALPAYAHNGRLNDVLLVTEDGTEVSLPQRRQGEADRGRGAYATSDTSYEWFFKGDAIGLYPTPSSTRYTLRMRYYPNPASYVAVSGCSVVSSLTSTVITATQPYPDSSETSFHLVSTAGQGAPFAVDLAGTIATVNLTTAETIPTGLAAGDYVCSAGQSCVISLPDQAYSVLVDLLVARMMQSQKDKQAASDALAHAREGLAGLVDALSDRVDHESEVYTSDDSPMWAGGYYERY